MFQIVPVYLEASEEHLNLLVLLFQIEKEIFLMLFGESPLAYKLKKKKKSRTTATGISTRGLNEKCENSAGNFPLIWFIWENISQ